MDKYPHLTLTLNMMVDMLNKIFTYNIVYAVLCFAFVVVPISDSYAGEELQCDVHYESVTNLIHPDPGSYTIWDSLYGDQSDDSKGDVGFISILNYDDGVLALGEERSLNHPYPAIMFVHFDARGRKVWDKYHNIRGLKNIVRMLPNGEEGYVVLANYKKSDEKGALWLGFFDHKGKLNAQRIIRSDKFNLTASDITLAVDGNGWAVSVTQMLLLGGSDEEVVHKNAAVYLLNKKGYEINRRAYILGANNEISGISAVKYDDDEFGYIATGYFESPSRKRIGWVLRLRDDISMAWQREFGRGLSANLKLSSDYNDDYMLVFGDVKSAENGNFGNWLMLLDKDSGQTLWQRYYSAKSGHHDYSARGMYVNDDGLVTLMMMASSNIEPPEDIYSKDMEGKSEQVGGVISRLVPEYMDYAQVLTISPRGLIIDGDSYYYGRGVSISQVIEGADGSRVIAGSASVFATLELDEERIDKADIVPLKEAGKINLPKAKLSSKAKDGLALLKGEAHGGAINIHNEAGDKVAMKVKKESAKAIKRNGWVAIGNMVEDYKDPCARPTK